PDATYLEPDDEYLEPEAKYLGPGGVYPEPNAKYLEPDATYLEPDDEYLEPEAKYLVPDGVSLEPDDGSLVPNANTVPTIAALVEELKTSSSKWLKTQSPDSRGFAWQHWWPISTTRKSIIGRARSRRSTGRSSRSTAWLATSGICGTEDSLSPQPWGCGAASPSTASWAV